MGVMRDYDSLVVGAGIIGLATAYHIKRLRPDSRILVIDQYGSSGQGNTARSAAMFRSFFYSATNLTLVDTTVGFFKHAQTSLDADLKLKWTGYLWLFSKEQYDGITRVLRTLADRGLKYEILNHDDLSEQLKLRTDVATDAEAQMMGLKSVHKGLLIPKAGSIDIDMLVKFYESEFRRMGGHIQYSTKAEKIVVEATEPLGISGEPLFWQKSRAAGVKTNRGELRAEKTIIAVGAWANTLLYPVGVYVPMMPIKRQLFSVKATTEPLKQLLAVKGLNPEGCMPFIILPKPAVYIKPALEEEAFWLSYGDHFPRAFDLEEDPQPEENFYRYGIYQVLVKYLPQFQSAQPHSAWAGQYALNTIDGQPVIFEENGLIVVGSCSGSGNMKCDAIGRIAAALYAGKKSANLFGDQSFRVADLGLTERSIEPEKLII
jgi:glycine/D-amino acid oxidase-like deaminating enzyme